MIKSIVILLVVICIHARSADIVINEFMAANDNICRTESGKAEDWVELFNSTLQPIDIGGWYLTDNLAMPSKWMVPDAVPEKTTIPPGEFLLIWLDGSTEELHADFRLSQQGESIGLFEEDGKTPVDTISFTLQKRDVSFGRATDGASTWKFFDTPTPGGSNTHADDVTDYRITVDPLKLQMIRSLYTEDIEIPATLVCRGQTWNDITIRIRGDSSREFPKKSFRIEFGDIPFVDGRTSLLLNAEYLDRSYLHTIMSAAAMHHAGQPCFNAEFARVHINGTYSGVYVSVEAVNKRFLERNGFDPEGNLYKAKIDGASMSAYDDVYYHWDKKTNKNDDRADLADLISGITSVPDSSYISFIKDKFNYTQVINYLSVNLLINNCSTYYHNYYLFHDVHATGKWSFLPWDLDKTFDSYSPQISYCYSSNSWAPDNVLLERMMMHPLVRSDIRARIATLNRDYINDDSLSSLIDSLKHRILTSVINDKNDDIPDTATFNLHCENIHNHLRHRYAYLEKQFAHAPEQFRIHGKPVKSDTGLTFSWDRAVDPDGDPLTYTLRYAKNPYLLDSNTTVITGISDTTWVLDTIPPEGTYYWSVTALDGSYATEGYNSWNTFTVYPGNMCLSLPVFHISIAPRYLDILNADPLSDNMYPATITIRQREYACTLRYRGASTRTLPKKSFNIKFPDRKNPFGVKMIKFNAEYRDRSLMRNHLAMKLCRHMKLPASHTGYANLFLNGHHQGIYLQVESVNNTFVKNRGYSAGEMYKAISLGATMAPINDPRVFKATWEKKEGDTTSHDSFSKLLNRVYYWTDTDFNNSIDRLCNVEEILMYYAVQLAIANTDGITKNMYLFQNPSEGKWNIIPWDMDASFGNDWEGIYQTAFELIKHTTLFNNHVLLNRLVTDPKWDSVFIHLYTQVLNEGFSWLSGQIDSVYKAIYADAAQDMARPGDTASLHKDINRIRQFLKKRTAATRDIKSIRRTNLYNITIRNSMPGPENPNVTFRARSEHGGPVYVSYTTDVCLSKPGETYHEQKLELHDDGKHNDGSAGDSIYGNELAITQDFPKTVPCTFILHGMATPPNGLYMIDYYPTVTASFAPQESTISVSDAVSIESVHNDGNSAGIILKNNSSTDINLSGACLRIGAYFDIVTLPQACVLAAHSRIFIADEGYTGGYDNIPGKTLHGFYFNPKPGDSISLLTPSHQQIFSTVITTIVKEPPRTAHSIRRSTVFSFNNKDRIIEFTLSSVALVTIKVYNMKGQVVETAVNSFLGPAKHRIPVLQRTQGSGCYIVRCSSDRTLPEIKKVTLLH